MNLPNIHDLVTHLDPRNCGLTVQLSEQAAAEINIRHRERVAEREEQLSKVTAERDEARAELARMREAIKEAHAALSAHNHTNGCCCDACHAMNGAHPRHDDLCVNTQSALTKLQPFIK